jgi:hypothetical protein
MLMQVKLLRLIQERAFTRVGGKTAIKSGARIICATNTDLEAAVAEGCSRRDLYYRINVIPVVIPPLRDRSERHPAAHAIVHTRVIEGVSPRYQRLHGGSRTGFAPAFLARQRAGAAQPRREGGGNVTGAVDRCGGTFSIRGGVWGQRSGRVWGQRSRLWGSLGANASYAGQA